MEKGPPTGDAITAESGSRLKPHGPRPLASGHGIDAAAGLASIVFGSFSSGSGDVGTADDAPLTPPEQAIQPLESPPTRVRAHRRSWHAFKDLRNVQRALPEFTPPSSKRDLPIPPKPKSNDTCSNLSNMSNNPNTFPNLEMNANRQAASPNMSQSGQVNGNGGNHANYMAPLPVGHQQDLNFLFSQIQELSSILKDNRGRVTDLTLQAEQLAKTRGSGAVTNGAASQEIEDPTATIRDLEHKLAKANHIISLYKHEQTENTKLIADYEEGMGTATEQIRNYCSDNNERYLALRRHYNNLLQAEKDEHLQSRLDRDHWHAQTMRVCEMIRTAHRLRCEEDGEELKIVSALQAEVRIYRKCLGMEREKPEEETGWPYLKEAPLNLEGVDET